MREGGARGARQARVSLCVGVRGWLPPTSDVVFVHQTARPTRFSMRKAVQGGAEGAWGLGSECCGQALRWRRVCAPVLRRQRCACERLTSRGVRGRVGFRFGRPVFWAGAGAEGLRRWPASLLQTALGAEAGPAPDERRGGRITVSSLGGGRSASGAQDPGRSIRAQRWSSRIGPDLRLAAPRPTREGQTAASPSTPSSRICHRDDASMASGRTCSTTPLGRLCRLDLAPAQKSLPGRTHVGESRRRETHNRYLVSALDLNLHTRGARALV